MEGGAKSAKAKVEARPTVTRRSRKVDSSTGLQLKQRLAEALEQHAAISEILQVISASPSDVQPLLDAVAERVLNLCDAAQAGIFLVEDDTLRFAARAGSALPTSPSTPVTMTILRPTAGLKRSMAVLLGRPRYEAPQRRGHASPASLGRPRSDVCPHSYATWDGRDGRRPGCR